MTEKIINDLITCLEELKAGKHGDPESLNFNKIMMHLIDTAKAYTIDPKDLAGVASLRSDMTLEDIKNHLNINQ